MRLTLPKEPVPNVEELARLQGIAPVEQLDEWLGQLPIDQPETGESDLYEIVMQLRRELRATEQAKR